MTAQLTETNPTEELAGRLFTAGVGALELGCAYLGVRLGLYRALADHGPQSAAELASRTGLNQRYAREWLRHQAISGLVHIDGDDVVTGTFSLADGVDDVFVDETSPAYLGGLPNIFAALGGVLPQLADAYRTGAAVSYAAYGPDAVIGQAALNRPAFANLLVDQWLPQLPDVLARLRDTAEPAKVGDFGCGVGWAAIELAKAFHMCTSTGWTTTSHRSPPGVSTRSTTRSPIAWTWRCVISPTSRPVGRRAMTSCSSSSACMTCRARWRLCATRVRRCDLAAASSSWMSVPTRC